MRGGVGGRGEKPLPIPINHPERGIIMLNIEPTNATVGAVVTGIDLSSLEDTTWSGIEAAFHEYGILIFPEQHLSVEAQMAFTSRFGEIKHMGKHYDEKFVWASNQRKDGTLYEKGTRKSLGMIANEGWHTDSSYMMLSAKASLLSAHVVSSQGAQTEFADKRAAYDALDEATTAQIAKLSAYHSLFQSQARAGLVLKVGDCYGYEDKVPPLRPLVKVHPVNKRPSLYIGRHVYEIPGLEPEAGEKLLADLTTFACQPPRTYQHNWQPGDIVIRDNRCVLHRACPYDRKEPRTMLTTRVAGDPATELAINA